MAKPDDKDDLTVEVDDPIPEPEEKPAPAETPAPETAKAASDADAAFSKLKDDLAREKSARIEAESRAQQGYKAAEQSEVNVHKTNLQLLTGAIESTKKEAEALKANYATAMANQDYAAAADVQYAMSQSASRLTQLEMGKDALEKQPPAKPQISQRPIDPVENFASQLTPRSAAWVRAHPQCVTDQKMMQKMIAAHNMAVADDIAADSDDYFAFVEDALKLTPRPVQVAQEPTPEAPLSAAAQPAPRRVAPPAAPVSRSGNGNGSKPTIMRLTAQEAEMARMMGMSNEEYAKNKSALIKEGKMN